MFGDTVFLSGGNSNKYIIFLDYTRLGLVNHFITWLKAALYTILECFEYHICMNNSVYFCLQMFMT